MVKPSVAFQQGYDAYVRCQLPLLLSCLMLPACAQVPEGYPKECEVHHKRLWLQWVPIEYGLIRHTPWEVGSEEDIRAGGKGFPHVDEWTCGGCSVEPGRSPTSDLVAYCSDCRRDYHRWLDKIGGKQNINYNTPELRARDAAADEAARQWIEQWRLNHGSIPSQGAAEVANPVPPR